VQGLLFVDEARNFVPSQKATPCREGFLRLAAQARNYRFGLIFATQNPKDIINTIVSQCSTHFYGKMNAPATIEAVRELLREKGAAGDDVPRLGKGEFYVHNADCIPKATKVKTKMCLSRHE
jgi:DNA helicase HerA-like ATPase